MAARIALKIGGKEHLYDSLHDATLAVRQRENEVVQTSRAHLDATIELGRWLHALFDAVPKGKWIAHLRSYGIHRKRANRAMRLATWDRDGRPNLTGTEKSGTNRSQPRPISVHQAEIAAGIRKPAAGDELVMEGYGPEGDEDFEEGDMEGHEMDGETVVDRVPLTCDPRDKAGVYVPPRTPVKPATGGQLTLASLYERDIAPHLAAVIESLDRVEAGVSVELIADVRALRDRIARAMKGGA
ncbi:MAG: hypothetical protein IT437_04065 [Phycisphaerales bacterium]|nr:hypothetical protein [Phycisphaerales bacterium]